MTNVKICGITNFDDARHAVACGADMLGFNFYRGSKRFINRSGASAIVNKLVNMHVEKVGVFVNAGVAEIAEIANRVGLDAVQLHGDETVNVISQVREILPNIPVVKAVRVNDSFTVDSLSAFGADRILLDSDAGPLFGGSGRTFDWSIVRGLGGIILAGGLTPENVSEAIREVRPFAVDVASGVESAPGKKDPVKVEQFIRAAKNALSERRLPACES